MRGDSTAHENELLDARGEVGIEADGGSEISQRSERDQGQFTFVFAGEAQEREYSMFIFNGAGQDGAVAKIAQPVASVEFGGVPPTPESADGRCRRKPAHLGS